MIRALWAKLFQPLIDPSTQWTVKSLHPLGDPSTLWAVNDFTIWVIHPLCGLCKLLHHLGDPSTLWTVNYFTLFGDPSTFVDFVNSFTLLVIRPLCELCKLCHPLGVYYVDFVACPSTLCSISIRNKHPCGKSKLCLNILL